MLESDRFKKMTVDFPAWLTEREWRNGDLPEKCLKNLNRPVSKFAAKVLDKRVQKMLAGGSDFQALSVVELHELRIVGKKLRYATDFFTPLFKANIKNFTVLLKELQGLLGTMNDVTVMSGLLEGLLKDNDDRETIKYAGALIGWRAHQYQEVKASFGKAWKNFAKAQLPWWKK